ncbi:unnamed protein product [Nippostrongylus brasiliensis]|uniref:Uncharacterized protein n=1 Tax=Nippostrongylus brasiliensis TaxID=27835 RepID=A0A0N4YRJ4_NIPBR|nr:unnamed protein product [Nippostrongylus brasiliensis]
MRVKRHRRRRRCEIVDASTLTAIRYDITKHYQQELREMWLWFLTALSFALTFYISAIACGCGEREADKIAKRAAMEREFKRQQQLQQQQQQREKSAELLKKSNEVCFSYVRRKMRILKRVEVTRRIKLDLLMKERLNQLHLLSTLYLPYVHMHPVL